MKKYEALKNIFGDEIAQKVVEMLEQEEPMNWSMKRVLSLCEGYPDDTSTQQFARADNLNDIGWEHHAVGEFNKALDCYRQALDLCPQFPLVWNNKGLAHFRLVQFSDAKWSYDKAITINPLFIKPYSNLGVLYYHLKNDYEQARTWFIRVLALDPNYHRALEYLRNIDNQSRPPDVLMIGTDPNLAAGLIKEFQKQGKKTWWIK